MDKLLPIRMGTVVLDSRDSKALSDFYIRMLGWQKTYEDDDWIDIQSPTGGVKLGFQTNPDYTPPTWPEEPPHQQQMLHIDFEVASRAQMEQAVQHAVACGAAIAPQQYSDLWIVMLDPAGHPFCFVLWE